MIAIKLIMLLMNKELILIGIFHKTKRAPLHEKALYLRGCFHCTGKSGDGEPTNRLPVLRDRKGAE
jgi:hypothetical protein